MADGSDVAAETVEAETEASTGETTIREGTTPDGTDSGVGDQDIRAVTTADDLGPVAVDDHSEGALRAPEITDDGGIDAANDLAGSDLIAEDRFSVDPTIAPEEDFSETDGLLGPDRSSVQSNEPEDHTPDHLEEPGDFAGPDGGDAASALDPATALDEREAEVLDLVEGYDPLSAGLDVIDPPDDATHPGFDDPTATVGEPGGEGDNNNNGDNEPFQSGGIPITFDPSEGVEKPDGADDLAKKHEGSFFDGLVNLVTSNNTTTSKGKALDQAMAEIENTSGGAGATSPVGPGANNPNSPDPEPQDAGSTDPEPEDPGTVQGNWVEQANEILKIEDTNERYEAMSKLADRVHQAVNGDNGAGMDYSPDGVDPSQVDIDFSVPEWQIEASADANDDIQYADHPGSEPIEGDGLEYDGVDYGQDFTQPDDIPADAVDSVYDDPAIDPYDDPLSALLTPVDDPTAVGGDNTEDFLSDLGS